MGDVVQGGHDLLIVHPRRPKEADRGLLLAWDLDVRGDDRDVLEPLLAGAEVHLRPLAVPAHGLAHGLGAVEEFQDFLELLGVLSEFGVVEEVLFAV